jgi:hypothetical protein
MSYFSNVENRSPFPGLGCGPACKCGPCKSGLNGFDEWYEKEADENPARSAVPLETSKPLPPVARSKSQSGGLSGPGFRPRYYGSIYGAISQRPTLAPLFRRRRSSLERPTNSFLGQVPLITRAQNCQQLERAAKSYPEIQNALKCELQIPFTDPNDPGLYRRRLRLRSLFKTLTAGHAKLLLNQLTQKNDALAQLFLYRLSSPTYNELLGILKALTGRAQPTSPPSPTRVWFTEPLPPSEFHRFEKAIKDLEAKALATTDPRRWRYLCWIKKLKSPDVDDRIIRWSAICPRFGARGAAFVVGPCDLTSGTPVDQTILEQSIRSVSDVEVANKSLQFIKHMRSDIVVSFEMTSQPLENLRMNTDDAGFAIDKLEQWSDAPMGGSSAMPPAYRAIKAWLKTRQNDPKSLYSCF